MRWNGAQWEKVNPMAKGDTALYIAAFDDLLEGAPGATFLYAIIGKIFTRHIIMTQDGVIESSGFNGADGGVNGFRFSAASGLLEAIGAKFRNGIFSGELIAGPLKSNTEPVFSLEQNYLNGTPSQNVADSILNFLGVANSGTGPYYSFITDRQIYGTYGSRVVIKIRAFYYVTLGIVGRSYHGITLYFDDQTIFSLDATPITNDLIFRYKTEGWNVNIANIPTQDPKTIGSLYRSGNNLMISNG